MEVAESTGATPSALKGGNVYDAVVVGAGFSGLLTLYRLRESGLRVRAYEAADGVGGTWYWNRYPNARVDFESFEYSYGFSDSLQQEWSWSEHYAGQPELLRYLDHVADRFDLRRDIQLSTRVTSAHFDEADSRWNIRTDRGDRVSARFLVMATGLLSTPKEPDFEGLESYRGRCFLTAQWPEETPDLRDEIVGVIGTGSSGTQVIRALADRVRHLFVFQRTAPYVVPAHNGPMDPEYEERMKRRYAELRENEFLSETGIAMLGGEIEALPLPRPISALSVEPAERLAEYERRWQSGSLCLLNAYNDLIIDPEANETLAEFLRAKIYAAVDDPAVAEKLIPRSYPVFSRRLSVCDDYYSVYNRRNVSLVDIAKEPIGSFEPTGLTVGNTSYPLDSVVFALGFDAQTGPLTRMDIRGREGRRLSEVWKSGVRSFLGLMTSGFPNLFYVCGPSSPTAFYPPIILAEYQTRWILRCIEELRATGKRSLEPTPNAEDRWIKHSREIADMTVFPAGNSWYMGANIPGKPRELLSYIGGFTAYRAMVDETLSNGLRDFKPFG